MTRLPYVVVEPNHDSELLNRGFLILVGILMGIAIRTGSPLSLNLAEPVWKQLAGMALTPADLTEVDRDYVPGTLQGINISWFHRILLVFLFDE